MAAGARGIGPSAAVVKGALAWRTLVCRTPVVLKAKTEFIFGLTTLINILHHHLRNVGEELGIEVPNQVPVMVDASAAIAFAKDT